MARFWCECFGDSVAVIRRLSASISLLAFPLIYLLCRSLFASPLVAEVAVAIIAVSPFHILYAREARPYSLWIVTILLSSWLLLRNLSLVPCHVEEKPGFLRKISVKLRDISSRNPVSGGLSLWLYAGSLAVSFYTFLLSGLVALAHGIYLVAVNLWRMKVRRHCPGLPADWSRGTAGYLVALVAALVMFSPWMLAVSRNWSRVETTTAWTGDKMPLFSLLKIWAANISRLFFDINFDSESHTELYAIVPILISLGLVAWSIYFLIRHTPPPVWLFVVILMAVGSLSLIIPDLIWGGRRSSISRYLIPCYLAIEIAVAYFTAAQLETLNQRRQNPIISIFALILIAGIVSGAVIAHSDTWWIKKNSHHNPVVAEVINQMPNSLLISSNYRYNFGEILSLSHLLAPQVRLLLLQEPNFPQIPSEFSNILVFNPSPNLIAAIKSNPKYRIKHFQQPKLRLWQGTIDN